MSDRDPDDTPFQGREPPKFSGEETVVFVMEKDLRSMVGTLRTTSDHGVEAVYLHCGELYLT